MIKGVFVGFQKFSLHFLGKLGSLFFSPVLAFDSLWPLFVGKSAGISSRHYLTREACSDAIHLELYPLFCSVIGWFIERGLSARESHTNKINLSHDVTFLLSGINMVEVNFLDK